MTAPVRLTRPQRVFRFIALMIVTTYEALHTALVLVVEKINERADQPPTVTVPARLTLEFWEDWVETALADLPEVDEGRTDDRA